MKFIDSFVDVTKKARKLPTSEYKITGKHPIIDQGQKQIAGYTDIEEGLFTDVPSIIFGDHTRVIKYIDTPFFIGADGVKVIKCLDKQANYNYLYYLLSSVRIPNTGYNRHYKWLKEARLVEHTKDEQEKIVAVLSTIDNTLDLYSAQLSKLDELIKSRFVEMFGDPVINPFNWKMKTFKDICCVRQGLQIPISKRLLVEEEDCYRYITVAYLHGSKETEYIKSPKSNVICKEDDILMTRTGNTGMVITDVHGVFHNNFFLIDFNRHTYNKSFLVHYLRLDNTQIEIMKRAGTSTIPDLNHSEFYKIKVYEPPLIMQNQFADFVTQVEKQKATVQQSIEKLETLKKSLMQEYFG